MQKRYAGKHVKRNRKIKAAPIVIFISVLLMVTAVISAVFIINGEPASKKGSSGTLLDFDVNENAWEKLEAETIVVVDAGHGFGDTGTFGGYLEGIEADATMSIVSYLKTELENRGITVLLTHDGEEYPSAQEVVDTCARYGVSCKEEQIVDNNVFSATERAYYIAAMEKVIPIDLFISIHINSIPDHPDVDRYELYYYEDGKGVKRTVSFCETLSEKLDNTTLVIGSDYDNAFVVTKLCECPAVLVESGYATNENAAKKINSVEWRKEYAAVIAEAIEEEFK